MSLAMRRRYADCFATDEERMQVLAVKVPSQSNLSACSYRLKNYEHAIVHSTQVCASHGVYIVRRCVPAMVCT